MAIIRDQGGLASVLKISRITIWKWQTMGMPYKKEGFVYYYDTKEVAKWLKSSHYRAHLAEALEKYNQD